MAFAGQTLIPIPVVGALIGGFVGITMSKTFYDISLKTLKEAKEACQRRIEIEKECRESIRQLEMHQNQFKEVFERIFMGLSNSLMRVLMSWRGRFMRAMRI